jgi:hypothetical protein
MIEPDRLRGLIRAVYDGGEYSSELDRCVLEICEGCLSAKRTRHYYGDAVTDDILSDAHVNCSLAILERKVDLAYNPFSYLTRIAMTTLAGKCRSQNARARDLKEYVESVYDEQYTKEETEDI